MQESNSLPAGTTETLVGAVLTIIGYIWRHYERKRDQRKFKKEHGID